MKTRPTIIALLLAFSAGSLSANTILQFDTVKGRFAVELFDSTAPGTVTNFLNYVNRGAFTNSLVHRSQPGFVIQGGGFFVNASNSLESIVTDPPVTNEFAGVSNVRGTVAMARVGGITNSATSQWYVNLADNSNPLDFTDGGFTVFGRVLGNGMDVVDAIAAVPVYNFQGVFTQLPLIGYDGTNVLVSNLVLVNSITKLAPHSWDAARLRAGSDGKLRLLWRHSVNGVADGQVSLWTLDNNNGYLASQTIGPISGWSAMDVHVSPVDSRSHLVWTNTGSAVSIWQFGGAGGFEGTISLTPPAGWSAWDYKIGAADNKRHLLWQHTSGQVSLWTLSSNGVYESAATVGPFAGWSVFDQQIGALDNRLHLGWICTNGAVSLWRFNGAAFEGASTFGPVAGWAARQMQVGPLNSKVYLAWTNATGEVSLWRLGSNEQFEAASNFGPVSGWATEGLLVRPDNQMHMAWQNASDAISLWRLGADNAYQGAITVGPYNSWQVRDACVDANNKLHLLWVHVSGQISLWTLSAAGALESTVSYGPY